MSELEKLNNEIQESIKIAKEHRIASKEYEEYPNKKLIKLLKLDKSFKKSIQADIEYAEKYEQLANWLEELQAYKLGDCMNDCKHYDNCSDYIYSKGYNNAIDEFAERLKFQLCEWSDIHLENGMNSADIEEYAMSRAYDKTIDLVGEIVENLRGGATDED